MIWSCKFFLLLLELLFLLHKRGHAHPCSPSPSHTNGFSFTLAQLFTCSYLGSYSLYFKNLLLSSCLKKEKSLIVMLGYSAAIYSPPWDKVSLHPHSLSAVGAGLLPHKIAQQYYYHIIIIITSLPAIQILLILNVLPL